MRLGRRTASCLSHRRRGRHGPRRRRERHTYRLGRPHDQCSFCRDAELELHSGFRARRLPPSRSSPRQLAGAPSNARGSASRGAGLGRPVPSRCDPRLRDRASCRSRSRGPGHDLSGLAFGRGLRTIGRRGLGRHPLRAGRRRIRRCSRDWRHPIGRPHVGAIRVHGQADAARLCLSRRTDRGGARRLGLRRHQARLRAQIWRLALHLR